MDDAQTKSDQADADFAAATDDYTAKLDDWNNYEDLLNRATSTQADAQAARDTAAKTTKDAKDAHDAAYTRSDALADLVNHEEKFEDAFANNVWPGGLETTDPDLVAFVQGQKKTFDVLRLSRPLLATPSAIFPPRLMQQLLPTAMHVLQAHLQLRTSRLLKLPMTRLLPVMVRPLLTPPPPQLLALI